MLGPIVTSSSTPTNNTQDLKDRLWSPQELGTTPSIPSMALFSNKETTLPTISWDLTSSEHRSAGQSQEEDRSLPSKAEWEVASVQVASEGASEGASGAASGVEWCE